MGPEKVVHSSACRARNTSIVSQHSCGLCEPKIVHAGHDVHPGFNPAVIAVRETYPATCEERPDVQIRRRGGRPGIPEPEAHLAFDTDPSAKETHDIYV